MPRLLFELALFFRTRLASIWLQILCDWIIRQTRDAYIDYKIIKHKAVSDRVLAALERERERRKLQGRSIPGPQSE